VVPADTVGVLTPFATKQLYKILTALVPVPCGTHFHDDLGLGLANALGALEGGAQLVHCTVNGVGERSGNTCTEEIAMVLKLKYGRDLGLKLDRLYDLCLLVHKFSGSKPAEHKSIVGKWCFTHEAGIHVAGVLANPETYQPYPPAMIGRQHEVIFGKHSGSQSVNLLADRAGLALSASARKIVLDRIKNEAETHKREVSPEQVIAWIQAEAS
jgi:isopropylmalate/homocitrate/citramalate synthase